MDLSRIPIFKLPASVSIQVVRLFDKLSLALLSVVSKKTMLMVRSVGFKTKLSVSFSENRFALFIYVGNDHYLSFLMRYDNTSNDIGSALPAHVLMISRLTDEVVKSQLEIDQSSSLFKAETWIKNLKCAFHVEEINVYSNTTKFCMRSICNIMRGVRINKLHATHNYQHFSQLIKMLHPLPNEIFPTAANRVADSPADQALTRKVLIQNFRFVALVEELSLDTLLMTNVSRLIFFAESLNNKEFNFFIKFWLKTKCTKLEHLYLCSREPLNENVVSEGIGYVKQPDSRVNVFDHTDAPLIGNRPAKGGYDIKRKDGTIATITLEGHLFRMIVWI
ncbi:unnamed protein product [Caenorhabditis brenneri]